MVSRGSVCHGPATLRTRCLYRCNYVTVHVFSTSVTTKTRASAPFAPFDVGSAAHGPLRGQKRSTTAVCCLDREPRLLPF